MLMYDDGYCSMGLRGRFYPYLYQVIGIGTCLYLGRAPRTKETLPNFREKAWYQSLGIRIPRELGLGIHHHLGGLM